MNKNGLLVEPDFDNPKIYLEAGEMTILGDKLNLLINEFKKVLAENASLSDGMLVRKILLWINENTKRINNPSDKRKFKRTAEEILESKERTGCADSATLFCAIARALNIPTMQIITLKKSWALDALKNEKVSMEGHFFVACYLRNINGVAEWKIIDSDRKVMRLEDVRFLSVDRNNRNIEKDFYSFAYVIDFRQVSINGNSIDSINNMAKVQLEALKQCDIEDFNIEEKII